MPRTVYVEERHFLEAANYLVKWLNADSYGAIVDMYKNTPRGTSILQRAIHYALDEEFGRKQGWGELYGVERQYKAVGRNNFPINEFGIFKKCLKMPNDMHHHFQLKINTKMKRLEPFSFEVPGQIRRLGGVKECASHRKVNNKGFQRDQSQPRIKGLGFK